MQMRTWTRKLALGQWDLGRFDPEAVIYSRSSNLSWLPHWLTAPRVGRCVMKRRQSNLWKCLVNTDRSVTHPKHYRTLARTNVFGVEHVLLECYRCPCMIQLGEQICRVQRSMSSCASAPEFSPSNLNSVDRRIRKRWLHQSR